MKNIIFVNATACTSGGVLSILNQFIENISKFNNENKYYIFASVEKVVEDKNIIFISDIKGKKSLDRIKWDLFGMKKWANKNNIKPDLIISLQNTGVRFNRTNQIVYIHQPLPYAKEAKWNFFKADERKLWIYKNIYKWWIDYTVKRNSNVIVQTEWMREALIERGYREDKISMAKPNVNSIEIQEVKPILNKEKYIFYPAADYKYKNHEVIIRAVKALAKENDIKFKVILTLNENSNIYKKVIEYGVKDYFEFIGNVQYEEILSYYKSCQALIFPSFIETFGLPLIEGSLFGKKILVSDCNYSREILCNYKLATFIKYNDVNAWKKNMLELFDNYQEVPQKIQKRNEWKEVFSLIDRVIDSKCIN